MRGELTRNGVRGEGVVEVIVAVMAQREQNTLTLVTREHKTNLLCG